MAKKPKLPRVPIVAPPTKVRQDKRKKDPKHKKSQESLHPERVFCPGYGSALEGTD